MVQASDRAIHQAGTQPSEQWFTLPGHHSWQEFQSLATLLSANYAGVRVFYLDSVTELMSLSPEHELIKSIVDALLVIFFCEQGINAVPMGSATLESEERSAVALWLGWVGLWGVAGKSVVGGVTGRLG